MDIGIDCDDVLLDYAGALVTYWNKNNHSHIKLQDLKEYDLQKFLKFSNPEQYSRFLEEFERSEQYLRMPVMKGAHEYLIALLTKGHRLHVITSRRPPHIKKTIAKLNHYFPGYFHQRIHFTHLNPDPIPKYRICKEYGIQLIIDDNPEIIRECSKRKIHGILFDRPWNRDPKSKLPRTNTWFNIDQLIASLIDSSGKKD